MFYLTSLLVTIAVAKLERVAELFTPVSVLLLETVMFLDLQAEQEIVPLEFIIV